MPVARFVRLLLTLFVLVLASGPASALGSWAGHRENDVAPSAATSAAPLRASAPTRDERHDVGVERKGVGHSRSHKADVGHSATSPGADTVRPTSRGRSGLLGLLSRALAATGDIEEGNADEFEGSDAPDLIDDDGPQGYVAGALSELSMPRLSGSFYESGLWGIQPSIGHPRGDDEPPRL